MEAERLNFLLTNPSDATEADVALLEDQVALYPYSQALHILLAKIQHLRSTEDKSKKLGTAAIYSSDRAILKKAILEQGYMEDEIEIEPYQDYLKFELDGTLEEEPVLFEDDSASDSANIFDEVLQNLEKLKSLRKQFQFLEIDEDATFATSIAEKKEKSAKKEKKKQDKALKIEENDQSDKELKREAKKKKLEDILERDLIIDSKVNAFYLKEIEEKSNEVEEEQRQAEKDTSQNEIIEKFIEDQPTIGAIKPDVEYDPDAKTKDLSEKSTQFGDDLISENLAVIMLRQGKRERAIDIYKKLIWKLPQKKAYFAARIEEIKK